VVGFEIFDFPGRGGEKAGRGRFVVVDAIWIFFQSEAGCGLGKAMTDVSDDNGVSTSGH
jgi:hypothetical protein